MTNGDGITKCRAVLFDLDGTLLDTIEDLAACMNAALQAQGLVAKPLEQHKLMVGDGVANYILRALGEEHAKDANLVARVRTKYRECYTNHWADFTRPYDGIEDMLDELLRHEIALAVLSNKPDDFTKKMVRHFFPAVPFATTQGATEGSPLKPDPQSALQIARLLDIDAQDFVYLGDTATDIKTARAAGMLAVGALWGFRGRQELQEAGAQALIEKPAELLPVVLGTGR